MNSFNLLLIKCKGEPAATITCFNPLFADVICDILYDHLPGFMSLGDLSIVIDDESEDEK